MRLPADANGAIPVLLVDGDGNPLTSLGGGSGDFFADGSVPMTGDLDLGNNNLNNCNNVNCFNVSAAGAFNAGDGTADAFFNMNCVAINGNYNGFNLFRSSSQKWFVGQGQNSYRGSDDDFMFFDIVLGDVSFWSPQGSGNFIVNNDIKTENGIYYVQGTAGWTGTDAAGTFIGGLRTA